LLVEDLSRETISVRGRRLRGLFWRLHGMRLPEYPGLARRLCVTAENEGRARQLLGPAVVDAILRWPGPGPAPWLCLSGGMLGVCIMRKHATNERTLRALYDYGRAVRRALEERLRRLRSEGSAGNPGPPIV
jgi:hypothetical protein